MKLEGGSPMEEAAATGADKLDVEAELEGRKKKLRP